MIDLDLFEIHLNPEQIQLDLVKDPMDLGINDMIGTPVHMDQEENDMNL